MQNGRDRITSDHESAMSLLQEAIDHQDAKITRLKALRCLGPQWGYTTIHMASDTGEGAMVSTSSNVFLGVLFQDDGGTQTSFLVTTGQTLGDALAAVDARTWDELPGELTQ